MWSLLCGEVHLPRCTIGGRKEGACCAPVSTICPENLEFSPKNIFYASDIVHCAISAVMFLARTRLSAAILGAKILYGVSSCC